MTKTFEQWFANQKPVERQPKPDPFNLSKQQLYDLACAGVQQLVVSPWLFYNIKMNTPPQDAWFDRNDPYNNDVFGTSYGIKIIRGLN